MPLCWRFTGQGVFSLIWWSCSSANLSQSFYKIVHSHFLLPSKILYLIYLSFSCLRSAEAVLVFLLGPNEHIDMNSKHSFDVGQLRRSQGTTWRNNFVLSKFDRREKKYPKNASYIFYSKFFFLVSLQKVSFSSDPFLQRCPKMVRRREENSGAKK